MELNRNILRENSIRGVYGRDLDESVFELIGRAFASYAGGGQVVVACDHRISSPLLMQALALGIAEGGGKVVEAGVVPKGLAVYTANRLNVPLAYVSASHLSREWNGLKFIHPFGRTFNKNECRAVYDLIGKADRSPVQQGQFVSSIAAFKYEYLALLSERIGPAGRRLKILLDHGNGTSVIMAEDLLRAVGFEVESIFRALDGSMPNRSSEPTAESLVELRKRMVGFDLGIAFDGDADRVVFVDPEGEVIEPERFAVVLLRRLMQNRQGPVVANVACSRSIDDVAAHFGQKLHRVAVGTPNMLQKVTDTGACLGMETSSHLVIPSIVGWDDAIAVAGYAAVALASAMESGASLKELLAPFPRRPRKRISFHMSDEQKTGVVREVERACRAQGLKTEDVDGLSVVTEDSWVLLRASNTEPTIRMVIESLTPEALEKTEAQMTAIVKRAAGEGGNINGL